MRPEDIGRLVTLGDAAVSPDGRWIAFTVRRVDLDANRYRSSVWLAAADGGSAPYQFTSGTDDDRTPVWSPDGRRLAVVSGTGTLRLLPVGIPGEPVALCERPEDVTEPVWSPDGSAIAFVSRERTARYGAPDEHARGPRRIDRLFSRMDGAGWIVDRPASVFVVPVDGSAPPRIVAGGPHEHASPAWSPDSVTLAVVTNREPDADLLRYASLYLVDVAGGGDPRRLTGSDRSYRAPSFSPDGTRIAALAADNRVVPAGAVPVIVDARTSAETVLADAPDRTCAPYRATRSPIWDDGTLWYSVEDHGGVHVQRSGHGCVLGGTRVVSALDGAGPTTAFLSSTPARCAELHVLDPGGSERRLTHLTDAFHGDVPGPDPVHMAVPSPAGDGDVDTWVLLPSDGEGPLPVLLSIHGGPMTQYPTAWFDEFRLWAGAGYAVVWCNPHGSTGHTRAWTRAIRAPEADVDPGTGWGGIDADDVLAALDAALSRFERLDRDRVGLIGGSYGGFLTCWLVAHTDRFAAACSERAVTNFESEDWSSDIAGWLRWELGLDTGTATAAFRRMSPLTYVDEIRTPMLLLHAENDLRCPVEQADALFAALRSRRRPVEYWRFPEEGHEMSRAGSPLHRVQRARIVLDFFARHLGGDPPG
ncbi:S9 family peptidase [Pseudonocardia endophytica]|uniref:Dipeptidyl aminopeptidase/acylaminoacyl peptidase n=1 Tax=Pseudonocardia endophytica TaxID=401976 RepID=A0A4R1I1Q0_PSEEN|nr:S9 family peptidase [Pseudonocardia endophytica]TCK26379.1 dipeptidyl aminopeptidase/acylaminoacyl peptidase [Pseudonocardia endophytica]